MVVKKVKLNYNIKLNSKLNQIKKMYTILIARNLKLVSIIIFGWSK